VLLKGEGAITWARLLFMPPYLDHKLHHVVSRIQDN
jgi:hypothetical protein